MNDRPNKAIKGTTMGAALEAYYAERYAWLLTEILHITDIN